MSDPIRFDLSKGQVIRCDERGEIFVCKESIEAIAQRVAELLEERKLETKP